MYVTHVKLNRMKCETLTNDPKSSEILKVENFFLTKKTVMNRCNLLAADQDYILFLFYVHFTTVLF